MSAHNLSCNENSKKGKSQPFEILKQIFPLVVYPNNPFAQHKHLWQGVRSWTGGCPRYVFSEGEVAMILKLRLLKAMNLFVGG